MVQVALPKLTFRLHDNPLLKDTDLQIVIIETERLPTLNYQNAKINHSWSFHQFNLLLQIIIGLMNSSFFLKKNQIIRVFCLS